MNKKHTLLNQATFALLILFSGLLMLPLTGLSAEELNWKAFANSYNADLDIVSNRDKGFPGSAFHYVATGYPPNTIASIEIDGRTRGAVMTDSNGRADFLIQTDGSDPLGRYYVSVFTDANFYASEDFRLRDDKPLQPAPAGWNGHVFTLFGGTPTQMTVNHDLGGSDSAFVFSASGFPANSMGIVAIDGETRQVLMTDGTGTATFAVQYDSSLAGGRAGYTGSYYVSINVAGTSLALSSCGLDDTAPNWPLPAGFTGPVIPFINSTQPTSVEVSAGAIDKPFAPNSLLVPVTITLLLATAGLAITLRRRE